MTLFSFTNKYIRTYRGFSNSTTAIVIGQVFHGQQIDEIRSTMNAFTHAKYILKSFFVKPVKKEINLIIRFRGVNTTITTNARGFFSAEIPIKEKLKPGWHKYSIIYNKKQVGVGVFFQPCDTKYGIISDIDDTYLISHTNSALRKIGVMLFRNATKRKAFEGVKEHYQLLHHFEAQPGKVNLFFNVSSSEWNLYLLLTDFLKFNSFPNAILLLQDLKSGIRDFISTGRGDHDHKFHKIERILQFYPTHFFLLIGDDTQADPYLYARVAEKYPQQIKLIQIRQVGSEKKAAVVKRLKEIPVKTHYFQSSNEAMERLKKM